MKRLGFLVALVGFSALAACSDLHSNDVQVIGDTAVNQSLPKSGRIYVYLRYDRTEIDTFFQEKKIGKSAQQKILSTPLIPSIKSDGSYSTIDFQWSSGCYKTETSISKTLPNPDNEVSYIKLIPITNSYYIASSSNNGCFSEGTKERHDINILYIEKNEVSQVTEFDKKFSEWASELNIAERYWYGVSTSQVDVPKTNGRTETQTRYSVTSPDAYTQYFQDTFDEARFRDDMSKATVLLSRTPPSPEQKASALIVLKAEAQ